MVVNDVSKVTDILLTLLGYYFRNTYSDDFSVVSVPPDNLNGNGNLGIYLYHVGQNADTKNMAHPENPDASVPYTPLGLDLYYIATPHHNNDAEDAELSYKEEQLVIGHTLRALTDYSIIDSRTMITNPDTGVAEPIFTGIVDSESTSVFKDRFNAFRIEILNIEHTQSMPYWNTSSNPLRLSIYFRVSVILLEPREFPFRPGRVLSYGPRVFPMNPFQLFGSRNSLKISSGGGDSRSITLSPAQVPVGDTETDNLRVTFRGVNLARGESGVYINLHDGTEPKLLPRNGPAEFTLWDLAVTGDRISMTVQPTLAEALDTTIKYSIVPGMYTLFVKQKSDILLSDGSQRPVFQKSNEIPFYVTPYVTSITYASIDGIITAAVTGISTLDNESIIREKTRMFVGIEALEFGGFTDTPGAGEYSVHAAHPVKITFRLTPGMLDFWNALSRKALPVRFFVNSMESQPQWIVELP